MQAAIYVRVSTDEQADQGVSIPAQKSRLSDFCRAQGWTVYECYIDDGYSGKDLNRPAVQKLISDAQAGHFSVVLVYKLDRLSRRQRDVLYLLEDVFAPAGIGFKSSTEAFDTTTPFGRAALSMMAVFSQLERETIIERIQMAKKETAKQGRFLGGPIPYGYIHNPENKSLIINEIEAETIRYVYKCYIEKGMGCAAISRHLNEKNIPWRTGKQWRQVHVTRMLDNSLYAGMISRLSDNFEGRHEAIISPDIWDKAQEIRKGRSYRSARYTALLSGIIYCGECGTRMRSKKLHGVSYPYYVCYAQDRSHPDMIKSDNHCLCGYKPAHKIDQKVIGQLGNGQAKIALPEVEKKDIAKTRAQLEKKLADTNKRLNRWYMAFEKEAIDIMELNERVLELKNEKKYLEKQIEMIELEKEEVRQRQINMSVLSELLKSFPLLWEKGTREERRALIVKIVSRVTVYKDNKVEVEYHVK